MASCRRVVQIGTRSASSSIHRWFNGSTFIDHHHTHHHACLSSFRYMSQLSTNVNGKRAFLVDTLALVRGLEDAGIPPKHAEAITTTITRVSSDNSDSVAQSCVSKQDIQKMEMTHQSSLSQFHSELKSFLSQFRSEMISSQEHHFSSYRHVTEKLQNDIEKMRSESKFENEKLQNDIEKLRGELRFEIDKLTAGQRLDLNLERGRISDELQNQNAETTNLNNKIDREITDVNNKIDRERNAYRAHVEASKYEVIKYCIGTFVSISAIGLAAIIRVLM